LSALFASPHRRVSDNGSCVNLAAAGPYARGEDKRGSGWLRGRRLAGGTCTHPALPRPAGSGPPAARSPRGQRRIGLHAASVAATEDQPARERLLRSVLRPPLAKERLTLLPDHCVRLELKRPFRRARTRQRLEVTGRTALPLLALGRAHAPHPRSAPRHMPSLRGPHEVARLGPSPASSRPAKPSRSSRLNRARWPQVCPRSTCRAPACGDRGRGFSVGRGASRPNQPSAGTSWTVFRPSRPP
jgi:hypothetical protein